MNSKRRWTARLAIFTLAISSVSLNAAAQYGTENGEWKYYAGDSGSTHYAPLDQINRENVADLEVKWRWTSVASEGDPESNYEPTPLVIDGVLYVSTGRSEVAALDPATGVLKWHFVPEKVDSVRGAISWGRGVAFWSGGPGDKRVIHSSYHGYLMAIDAETGKVIRSFGDGGYVDLREELTGRPVWRVKSNSPPIVVGDVIVVQIVPRGAAGGVASVPGNIRGYDVRTGKRLWTFNVIPQAGEFGVETWEDGSWKRAGHAGVWTTLSADQELGYVYLPTETSDNDWYGGHRPGDNLFAESLVCLDAKTGERVWHFQLVHHGIWDYDNPAAPVLCDITVEGREIKAVVQVTKQGYCYVFNRVTGEPVWPIIEFPVPASDIPNEKTSPTQPIPTRPAPFERVGFDLEDLNDLTPEIKAEAMRIASDYVLGRQFTPPTLVEDRGTKGTLVMPGYGGGANWPGAAFDPETGILYVPSATIPIVAGMGKGDPSRSTYAYTRAGPIYPPGPFGLPLVKPPWGRLTAIDLNTGDHLWMRPLGVASDEVRENPALKGVDLSEVGNNGRVGILATKTLLFAGEGAGIHGGGSQFGAGGTTFRAFDKRTGDVVHEMDLPSNVSGVPMTYMLNGKQYIVIALGRRGAPGELIALALP